MEEANSTKRISWYPGHIKAAEDELKNKWLPLLDLVIELVDSRVPLTSKYPDSKLWGSKANITIYTKKDLSGLILPSKVKGLVIDVRSPHQWRSALLQLIKTESKATIQKLQKQGRKRPLRIGVCGLPNVGKSTFINSLAKGSKRTKTGNTPGITRQMQWISCSEFDLLDTPGLMPLSVDQKLALKLALCRLLPEKLFDALSLAQELIEILKEQNKNLILPELLDDEKKANLLIKQFQEGKLGQICLDSFEC